MKIEINNKELIILIDALLKNQGEYSEVENLLSKLEDVHLS